MIKLVNIYKQYGDKLVLNKVNYTFKDRGLYFLKGNSGSGKTTLLKIISGRCECEGQVIINDEVFYLSFNNYLVEELTVKENIELHKDLFKKFQEYKNRLQIDTLMNKKVSKLSIGEKQRVGLFLALSSNCGIILLDEIFSGVDSNYKKLFVKEIKKVSKKRLVILTSHQDFVGYDYILHLENGKIREKSQNLEVANKKLRRKLDNSFKWGLLLHKKQFFHRLMLLLSIISIGTVYKDFNNEFTKVKEDFNSSFSNNKIYYKNSKNKLNDESFYEEIVLPLANEIKEYSYDLYSEGMYEARVMVGDSYLGNGDLFTKINYIDGLKENEVVLMIDNYKYCLNNGYEYCPFNQVKEELIGSKLIYKYDNKEMTYLIRDVVFSKTEGVYLTFNSECLKAIEDIHSKDIKIKKYYIVIDSEKLESFYNKINIIDSLLHYNFEYLYNADENNYFLVSENNFQYFNEEEISEPGVVACSEYGYSCSSIDFSKFQGIYYINNIEVKDKVFYKEYSKDLDYREIIISSSLAEFINKKEGDKLTLRFYIDDSFYVLDDVEIIKIVENTKFTIYHSKYDYFLFKEIFHKNLRITYLYSEGNLEYNNMYCLHYDLIYETKNSINGLIEIVKMSTVIFIVLMIIILFIIESNKLNKHRKFFEFIDINKSDIKCVYNSYMFLYILIGILFNDLFLSFIYYFIFIVFYLVNMRKIKSRLTLD